MERKRREERGLAVAAASLDTGLEEETNWQLCNWKPTSKEEKAGGASSQKEDQLAKDPLRSSLQKKQGEKNKTQKKKKDPGVKFLPTGN